MAGYFVTLPVSTMHYETEGVEGVRKFLDKRAVYMARDGVSRQHPDMSFDLHIRRVDIMQHAEEFEDDPEFPHNMVVFHYLFDIVPT